MIEINPMDLVAAFNVLIQERTALFGGEVASLLGGEVTSFSVLIGLDVGI